MIVNLRLVCRPRECYRNAHVFQLPGAEGMKHEPIAVKKPRLFVPEQGFLFSRNYEHDLSFCP